MIVSTSYPVICLRFGGFLSGTLRFSVQQRDDRNPGLLQFGLGVRRRVDSEFLPRASNDRPLWMILFVTG